MNLYYIVFALFLTTVWANDTQVESQSLNHISSVLLHNLEQPLASNEIESDQQDANTDEPHRTIAQLLNAIDVQEANLEQLSLEIKVIEQNLKDEILIQDVNDQLFNVDNHSSTKVDIPVAENFSEQNIQVDQTETLPEEASQEENHKLEEDIARLLEDQEANAAVQDVVVQNPQVENSYDVDQELKELIEMEEVIESVLAAEGLLNIEPAYSDQENTSHNVDSKINTNFIENRPLTEIADHDLGILEPLEHEPRHFVGLPNPYIIQETEGNVEFDPSGFNKEPQYVSEPLADEFPNNVTYNSFDLLPEDNTEAATDIYENSSIEPQVVAVSDDSAGRYEISNDNESGHELPLLQ